MNIKVKENQKQLICVRVRKENFGILKCKIKFDCKFLKCSK